MKTTSYYRNIGKTIYALRWEHRISKAELAAKCNRSEHQIRKIENGLVNTHIGTIKAIAEVFGLSPAAFLALAEKGEFVVEQ